MSTLSIVKKGLNQISAPPLVGADYAQTGNDFWMFNQEGTDYKFSYSGHNSSLKAYQKCPPVTAIINRKAQAFINGKTWVLDKEGKVSTSKQAKKLASLLAQPNPLQSQMQFEAQMYIYQQLFGFTILLPIKPVGYPNIEATRLWNIPPFMVDIEETEKLFLQDDQNGIIKQVVLKYKNTRTVLNVADIYIVKDFTPSFSSLVIPDSRICALEMPISNIIGAYESRGTLIKNRGALGILSPESDKYGVAPVRHDDKVALQEDYKRFGLSRNQWQIIISSAALKWQAIGVPTKDLMLFEEIDDDISRVCDGYNYPYRLLSSEKSNSLGGSDIREFKKLLYQDAIIPESLSFYEQLNLFFDTATYGINLNKDFSAVAALQADKGAEATARFTLNQALKLEWEAGLITMDQWLVKLGEDPLPNNTGNVRASDLKNTNVPLAQIIGVGGVQALMLVLTDQILSEKAKENTLQIVFGISPEDANRMVLPGNKPAASEEGADEDEEQEEEV